MRRLRCKVMKLTEKVFKKKCGHLNYMDNRYELIDSRMDFKSFHLNEINTKLTQEGRRGFATVRKIDGIRPFMQSDTDGVELKKENMVQRLCKYLTKEEIDEISDDPYFYLSNNGKAFDSELQNVEYWNIEAGLGIDTTEKGPRHIHVLPENQSIYYHKLNAEIAYDKANWLIDKKTSYFKDKNIRTRMKWQTRFREEKQLQQAQQERYEYEIRKKSEKAEGIILKVKEAVEFNRKERQEEERRKMDQVHANLDKLKEIEEINAMNETIRTACKTLAVNKLNT